MADIEYRVVCLIHYVDIYIYIYVDLSKFVTCSSIVVTIVGPSWKHLCLVDRRENPRYISAGKSRLRRGLWHVTTPGPMPPRDRASVELGGWHGIRIEIISASPLKLLLTHRRYIRFGISKKYLQNLRPRIWWKLDTFCSKIAIRNIQQSGR